MKNYSIFGTQGGGKVREIEGRYVFIEAPPKRMGLDVGDECPKEWDLIPVNQAARNSMDDMMEFF